MRKARSSAPIQQQRFCWRERTEKLNWRMLRALHLLDVVKRGDPTVLEPYVLHLTFARLPAAGTAATTVDSMDGLHGGGRLHAEDSGDQQRNAWFIVRVFQLATEYLLFMRSRDGAVLETLQKELLLCEKATPSAVSAIETLLRNMLPKHKKHPKNGGRNQTDDDLDEHTQRRIKEARQCHYCGKLFASADFLAKHHSRRHPGENRELRIAEPHPMKPIVQPHPMQDSSDLPESGEKALRQMLQQVEYALQEHQASLRSLAQDEAKKIESLYEQLHVENQLAEEIKASRVLAEKQVREAQERLDTVLQEKEDALTELRDLKEQIQFLDLKRKMEFQAGVRSSPQPEADQKDMSTVLEIKRLEQTLSTVNSTLSDSRKELSRLQEMHFETLKDKQALCDQLSESQNHVKRLENKIAESSGTESVPVARKDGESQTVLSETREASTQAENECSNKIKAEPSVLKTEVAVQAHSEMKPPPGVEIAIQTDKEGETPAVVPQVLDPIETEAAVLGETSPSRATEQTQVAASPSEDGSAAMSDYVYNIAAESVVDAVKKRAQRAIEDAAKSNHAPPTKSFSSLPGRKVLRSWYQHDEQTVQERVASQMLKLEQLSHRFGVPPKCNLLSSEHLQIVQQALHGHLEVLPAEVLQKMVECESAVNSIIEKEWLPREKTRQQALERLKVQTHAKSQLNQDLVKQAVTAFASVTRGDTGKQDQQVHSVNPQEEYQPAVHFAVQESRDESPAFGPDEPETSTQEDGPAKEGYGKPFNVKDLTVVIEERPSLVAPDAEENLHDITAEVRKRDVPDASIENHKQPDIGRHEETELKPWSADVSAIPPQAIEIVGVPRVALSDESRPVVTKVVTVSPKSSPAKSEIVDESQEQDVESSPAADLGVEDHDFPSLQTPGSLGEASTPSPGTEIEVRGLNQARVDAQSAPIVDPHSVSDSEDEAESEGEEASESQPFVASSISAMSSDESDEIEIVDIQSVSESARSTETHDFSTRCGVVGDGKRVATDQPDHANGSNGRDRDAPDRRQVLRSFRSSELSASMAASSELSFQTSIPSLEESDTNLSDMDNATKSVDAARDSREDVTIRSRFSVESLNSETSMEPERYDASLSGHDIPVLLSDDEASDLEETEARVPSNAASSQQNSPNTHGSRYDVSGNTSVMLFSDDDDSEIEEVELT